MNPLLKTWFHAKLDDTLNSIFIFHSYLTVPRPNFKPVNSASINLHVVKYVIEEIYGCKIQCEKCVVNVPEDFHKHVSSYFSRYYLKIDDNAVEYLFKWINSLVVLLTDDKSFEDIKEQKIKTNKRAKLLEIIEQRKLDIEKLKNNINKKSNKPQHDESLYKKRDEMIDGFKLDALSFGDMPNLTPDEMIIISKYRNNESLVIDSSKPAIDNNINLQLTELSKQTLQNLETQYKNNDFNLDDNEFKLIANFRVNLPLIESENFVELEDNLYDDESESDEEPDDIKKVELHEPSGKNIVVYKNVRYVVEGGTVVGKLNEVHNVNFKISNARNIRAYDKYFVEPLNKRDMKKLKRKGWNLNDDVDIDKKVFKINNDNTKDLRDVTRTVVKHREEARDKIPKLSKLEIELKKLQEKYENDIEKLNELDDEKSDAVNEYNTFIQSRIDLFNNYKLPVKNYGLNTDNENYFVSSVVHIIDKLCVWLNIKTVGNGETKTVAKILLPKNFNMKNTNVDYNSSVIKVLINLLSNYDYKLTDGCLNILSNVINNFDDVKTMKRLQVFANEGKFVKPKNNLPSFLVSDAHKKIINAPENLNPRHIDNLNTELEHMKKTTRSVQFYKDYKPQAETEKPKRKKQIQPTYDEKIDEIIKQAELKEDIRNKPEYHLKGAVIADKEQMVKHQDLFTHEFVRGKKLEKDNRTQIQSLNPEEYNDIMKNLQSRY